MVLLAGVTGALMPRSCLFVISIKKVTQGGESSVKAESVVCAFVQMQGYTG